MACRLFGAKPLSQPKLGYCQLDSWEQTSLKFCSKLIFIQENAFENIVCEMAAIRKGIDTMDHNILLEKLHFMVSGYCIQLVRQ